MVILVASDFLDTSNILVLFLFILVWVRTWSLQQKIVSASTNQYGEGFARSIGLVGNTLLLEHRKLETMTIFRLSSLRVRSPENTTES